MRLQKKKKEYEKMIFSEDNIFFYMFTV